TCLIGTDVDVAVLADVDRVRVRASPLALVVPADVDRAAAVLARGVDPGVNQRYLFAEHVNAATLAPGPLGVDVAADEDGSLALGLDGDVLGGDRAAGADCHRINVARAHDDLAALGIDDPCVLNAGPGSPRGAGVGRALKPHEDVAGALADQDILARAH